MQTYLLLKKYSKYVHIGKLGPKNCFVAGIRSRAVYNAVAGRLAHNGIGAIQKENAMNMMVTRCCESSSAHLRLRNVLNPSNKLNDLCSAATGCGLSNGLFAPDFLRLLLGLSSKDTPSYSFVLLVRNWCGIGLNLAR